MENEIKKKINLPAVRSYDIAKPTQLKQMAVVMREYIAKNELSVQISNKQYIMVEGWQFAGGLMGLTPRITEVKELGPNRWMAKAELYNKKGDVVSVGFASCSKAEYKKKSFDEYAILSMAQTRAIGKVYRNIVGWVVKMAGFEPTPAEEMQRPGGGTNQTGSGSRIKRPPLETTIASIRKCKDKETLMTTREKIKAAPDTVYQPRAKALIMRTIDERLGEIDGLKTIKQ